MGGGVLCSQILGEFDAHASRLRERSRARKEAVKLRSVATDTAVNESISVDETYGKWQPGDVYQGDVNIRTLRLLLSRIDELGFERSPHQMRFHSAFERSVARVLYKADWGVARPLIMKKHGWARCSSEVMISTPRRFGKTFRCGIYVITTPPQGFELRAARSIAIFAACMALTMKVELVIFSPARRASRKLLERIIECPPRPSPSPPSALREASCSQVCEAAWT